MRTMLFLSVAAIAAGQPAPALGQPGDEPLWSAAGRLDDSDSQDADARRYDEHRFRLEAGQRYRIETESDDFDTLIRLYRSGEAEPVAENDDSGESLNSRITYAPVEGGEHVLRVTSFSADGRGAYAARVEALPPLPPPITTPGTPVSASGTWSLWQGELAASDPEEQGSHYDDYLVRFEAGRTRFISLEATGFDPLVAVLRAAGRHSDPPDVVDSDDDAGVGFNSLLGFAPDEAGDYVVRVTSYGPGGAGAYRLWISQ